MPSNYWASNAATIEWSSWEFYVGTLVFSIIAYLVGSISGGQLISKHKSFDLKEYGSGNYGATNAGRAFGTLGFIAVFLVDVSKGIIAAMIMSLLKKYLPTVGIFEHGNINFALFFVVVGHAWPIFFKFKGGKGVATTWGVGLAMNWYFALAALLIFLLTLLLTKRVAISSMSATMFLGAISPLHILINGVLVFPWSVDWFFVSTLGLLGILSIFWHRDNIKKIITGQKYNFEKNEAKKK